jgi:hypothetical protein
MRRERRERIREIEWERERAERRRPAPPSGGREKIYEHEREVVYENGGRRRERRGRYH